MNDLVKDKAMSAYRRIRGYAADHMKKEVWPYISINLANFIVGMLERTPQAEWKSVCDEHYKSIVAEMKKMRTDGSPIWREGPNSALIKDALKKRFPNSEMATGVKPERKKKHANKEQEAIAA